MKNIIWKCNAITIVDNIFSFNRNTYWKCLILGNILAWQEDAITLDCLVTANKHLLEGIVMIRHSQYPISISKLRTVWQKLEKSEGLLHYLDYFSARHQEKLVIGEMHRNK